MTDRVDHPIDDLPGYVLDGTDRAAIEAHLRICPACTRRVTEYRATFDQIPGSLPLEPPPAAAWPALLARARAATPEHQPAGPRRFSQPLGSRRFSQPLGSRRFSQPLGSRRFSQPLGSRRFSQPRWLALAAAVLLAISVAVAIGVPRTAVLSEIQARLPGGQILPLVGTGTPGATARLYVAPGTRPGDAADLRVSGLAPLPADRIYQLWFARPGQPTITGGVFRVDAQGNALAAVRIPAPLDQVSNIAITEEPAPRSESPSGVHLLDLTP